MKNSIYFYLGICFSVICSFVLKPSGSINGEVQIADKKISITMENDHVANILVTRGDSFIERINFYGGGRFQSIELKEGKSWGKYFYDYWGPLKFAETYYCDTNNSNNRIEEITVYKTDNLEKSFTSYVNFIKNGKFKMFDMFGNIIIEGNYKDNKPIGKWKYYYEDKEFEITK